MVSSERAKGIDAISIEMDSAARALYMKLAEGVVASTVEAVADRVFVDVDEEGNPVGIEVLEVASRDLQHLLLEVKSAIESVQKSIGRDLALA
jgi:uncharacterized protein YuzE